MGDRRSVDELEARPRWLRTWALWRSPPRHLSFVLTVDAAAVVLTVAQVHGAPVRSRDILVLVLIVAVGVAVAELSRQVEQRRRRYPDRPNVNLSSVWTLAAALLLPPALTACVVAAIYVHLWCRGSYRERGIAPYRLVFTASSVLLACHAATTVMRLATIPPLDIEDWHSLGALLLVISAYSLTNAGLVACAIGLRDNQLAAGRILGAANDHAIEYATLGLGALTAIQVESRPTMLPLLIPAIIVLHRVVLLRQLEHAAATDTLTGLLNAQAWQRLAALHVHDASTKGTRFAVIMVGLDHLRSINDHYGHNAGDRALQLVAERLLRMSGPGDLVARFAGDEFVILCAGAGVEESRHAAEHVRRQVRAVSVPVALDTGRSVMIDRLSASVGVAAYPDSGTALHELLHAAGDALYLAKDRGRDRVVAIIDMHAGDRILPPDGDAELQANAPPRPARSRSAA